MPEIVNPPADMQALPLLPPNMAVLVVRAAPDKAHTAIEIRYDVTHLSEDAKKLLLHYALEGLVKFEANIKSMGRIEVAKKLALTEKAKKVLKNGD